MLYLYEITISFQLAGALILLMWCFSKISKNALDMCFPGVIFAKRKESGELYIDKEMIQQKVQSIFLNVSAFIYISIGYLTSVFTENNMENPWYKLVLIIITTALLILIAYYTARHMSAAWGKEDRILTDEEIEKYNIPTTVTEQEILDLFK